MKEHYRVTTSALVEWINLIAPGTTRQEAQEDLQDWARDAVLQDKPGRCGAALYRARAPLRCFFLVDESTYPPTITGVLRPHARWVPGGRQKRGALEESKGRGRPRSVTAPGQPHSEGTPVLSLRLPRELYYWIKCQPDGFARQVLQNEFARQFPYGAGPFFPGKK